MPPRLFVYGTLAPGRENAHLLAPLPGDWQPATVRGTLHPQGWGAALGYPGLVLHDDGDLVAGQVFTSDALDAHWAGLDDFEGDGYARVTTIARLQDGRAVDAWVYGLREATP